MLPASRRVPLMMLLVLAATVDAARPQPAAALDSDFVMRDFRFVSGETLPE